MTRLLAQAARCPMKKMKLPPSEKRTKQQTRDQNPFMKEIAQVVNAAMDALQELRRTVVLRD